MGMKIYDLYLILNVLFHSKGVELWVGDVNDYVILFLYIWYKQKQKYLSLIRC